MYLSRLIIRNFRSIKELDLYFNQGKNVIVGRNNTGKSNIVKAIDLVLGENQPTYAKSENVTESDFYSWKEKVIVDNVEQEVVKNSDEIFIYCELARNSGEELDFEEIYKCYGYYRYNEEISKDEVRTLFSSAFSINPDDLERNKKTYINPKLKNQQPFEKEFQDKFSFAFVFKALKNADGGITKNIRFLYRNGQNDAWIMAFTAPIRNELLQSAIIPSFRDPASQLRITNWTWYGKLIRHLTNKPESASKILDAFKKVKEIGDEIFRDAKNNMQTSALEVSFPNTEIDFQFNADVKADIYKNCMIYIDDGFKSLLTEKGSGIQSATIIGLFNYYVKHIAIKTSALLCIEEPELYLHPHARRVISDRLDDFLDNNKNQVIITTHSSEFIRTTKQDLNIIFVKKSDQEGTTASPINVKDYKYLLLDNNQNEIFFADKVIICEGYDNYILSWVAKEKFPRQLDEHNISIVSVGGKDNISKISKMIINMGINCYVFADFDYLLRDKGQEADKYDSAKKHESIQSLRSDFFKQKCIYGDKGEEIFAKINKLRTNIKKKEEGKFYIAQKINDFVGCSEPKIKELSDLLKDLRSRGIGILSGEIEDFSKDSQFVSSTKKIDLNKIFEISAKIENGRKISDLFDTSDLEEFLKAVLTS